MTEPEHGQTENTDSAHDTLTVEEIIALEERSSIDGLRVWLIKVREAIRGGEPAAGTHSRLFQRLAEMARAKADPVESDEVEALIADGQAFLASEIERQSGAKRGTAFLRKFQDKLGTLLGGREPELRPLSFLDVRDLIALENDVYYWSDPAQDCRRWLTQGLRESIADPAAAHLAFPPLQLIPGNRVPEQVGDAIALASGQEDLHSIADCIPPTLLTMLQAEPTPVFGDFSADAAAWRLAGCLGLEPGLLVPHARLYVTRAQANEEFWRLTAHALFEAVLRCQPATASQSEFFAWLRREHPTRWTPALDALLRQARAAEATVVPRRTKRRSGANAQPVTASEQAQLPLAQGALILPADDEDTYLPARTAQYQIDDVIPKTLVPT